MNSERPNIDLKDLITDQLIEYLPGIFYIYELIEGQFKMIHWNKNHELVTGYSRKELNLINVFEFFYEKDYQIIENGIERIIESGEVKQVHANLKLKDGSTLPYLFEGYQFNSKNRFCFMGVGIDMSSYIEAKNELMRVASINDEFRKELDKKERELLTFVIEKSNQQDFYTFYKKELAKLESVEDIKVLKDKIKSIEKKLITHPKKSELWEVFQLRFSELHQDFFPNLTNKHPDLTKSELKYCSYIRIKLSTNQIISVLNISKDGIKKCRYRIRKKVGLTRNESLENYINQF